MHPVRALVIYIAVVFVGGALLAPQFHGLAQALTKLSPKLADEPFHRYVQNSFLLLALAGLWPLLRAFGARSASDLGLVRPTGEWNKFLAGLAIGFISMAVLAGIAVGCGGRALPESIDGGRLAEKLVRAFGTAVVVGVFEEILFRGGIFGGIRRILDWRLALLLSSAIYALLHFFANARHEGPVTWTSGLALLLPMVSGFADWQQMIPGFFNLLLAGALLALAYQRTGNLYFSIGLHAAWIFWLKSYRALTVAVPDAQIWLFGTRKLIDGWLGGVVLLVTLILLMRTRFASKDFPV